MSATVQRNGRARTPRVPIATPTPPGLAPAAPVGTPHLDAAVLAVQAKAGRLIKNALGQVGPRTYGYVTLTAVTDEVLPLLVEHELLWKVFPTVLDDGAPGLRYRMTHLPSGEFDEDAMPLLCVASSQGLGSGITYARRYSLCAYLNLTVDEDDDGAAASIAPARDRYAEAKAAAQTASAQPVAAAPKPSGRPATVKQRALIEVRAREAKLEPEQLANVLKVAAGGEPVQWQDGAAQRWVKRALDRLPASLVDAVLEGIANVVPF